MPMMNFILGPPQIVISIWHHLDVGTRERSSSDVRNFLFAAVENHGRPRLVDQTQQKQVRDTNTSSELCGLGATRRKVIRQARGNHVGQHNSPGGGLVVISWAGHARAPGGRWLFVPFIPTPRSTGRSPIRYPYYPMSPIPTPEPPITGSSANTAAMPCLIVCKWANVARP